jgi:hypothetical protein
MGRGACPDPECSEGEGRPTGILARLVTGFSGRERSEKKLLSVIQSER